MKVLVNEIEKNDLINICPCFINIDEISILDDASIEYKTLDCKCPYYIEENIKDIDSVLKLCEDVSNNRTPIRNKISWDKFCLFWALMLAIYKQREVGTKVSDLEYLYIKFKDIYDIELTNAFALDLGYNEDMPIIVGKTNVGIMHLYKEDEYFDFVFTIIFESTNGHTHWHTSNFFEAADYLEKFMSNIDIV